MPTEIILPKVDMDMATGKISRWHVEEGGQVRKGDLLFEIETDKAAMEIDAPVSGTIHQISGKEGIDIPVGSPIAWIYEEGEVFSGATAAQPSQSAASRGDTSAVLPAADPVEEVKAIATGGTNGVRATPLARRIGREAGIDLSALQGSGPRGRILRADVEAFAARRDKAESSEAQTGREAAFPPRSAGDEAVLRLFAEGTYDLVPHDSMRRTIARRLVEAKSTVPHFYLTVDCEIDELLALRGKLNGAAPVTGGKAEYRISVNDMVIKALAMALRAVPDANVSWTENNMVRHRHADVGVAVSIPGGLITPIVRQAELKTLSAISNEMKDLAERARTRKLKAEEYQGGTTAVSNLDMFGVKDFAAIINPPHASILAVGAGERRAVFKGDVVVPVQIMSVTLSTDHRAVDGALGAQLIGAVKRFIENPYLMLA